MAWWNNEETDRPVIFNAVHNPAPKCKVNGIYPSGLEEAVRFETNFDIQINNAKLSLENSLFLAESAPHVMSSYGSLLGLLCVQAGGKLGYSPINYAAWLLREDNLYDRPLPELSLPCPQLDFLTEIIKRYHQAFGYDVVLGANPMIDPLTTLSMMRGVDDLCIDMIENPELVERWVNRLGEFHRQAVEGFRAARAAFGRREDFNWTSAWAPGDMDAVQCDFSTMLSPEMFRRFALPEAERETAFYDYSMWHLDGSDEFKHLDDICAIPGLNAIQYVDEKGRNPMQFTDVWKKILKNKKSIIFNCHKNYILPLTKELGRKGLAFTAGGLGSEKDMESLLNELK
jgi:hypothetical protein